MFEFFWFTGSGFHGLWKCSIQKQVQVGWRRILSINNLAEFLITHNSKQHIFEPIWQMRLRASKITSFPNGTH